MSPELVADGLVDAKDLRAHVKRYVDVDKPTYDAIIFTIKPEEFEATCLAFGTQPTGFGQTFQYAHADAKLEFGKQSMSVRIVQCDRQRNVPMAICCRTILEAHETKRCILVGIAAGNHKAGVQLGDVVVGRTIIDYEGGTVPPRRRGVSALLGKAFPVQPSHEPRTVNVEQRTQAELNLFRPSNFEWLHEYHVLLKELPRRNWIVPAEAEKRMPVYGTGTICSGEKVRRDGYIADLALTDRQIRALDMEASGFAAACRSRKVDWVVCRGISDFADADKGDNWHHVASLNAALAMRAYLRFIHQYQPPIGGGES